MNCKYNSMNLAALLQTNATWITKNIQRIYAVKSEEQ